jgi:hypothetical protein
MTDREAELKAKLAALKAEREAKLAPTEADRVAALERDLADAEAYAKAQDTHGPTNVLGVKTASGVVIVKRANHLSFKKFVDKNDFTTPALEALIAPCLVHPSADQLDHYLEIEPFKLQAISGAISRLAGNTSDEFQAK